jgi:hypothetical protein
VAAQAQAVLVVQEVQEVQADRQVLALAVPSEQEAQADQLVLVLVLVPQVPQVQHWSPVWLQCAPLS